MPLHRSRRQGHHYRGTNGRNGYRTEYVDVPSNACGLIVGKKGRNIKELQQMAGIDYIRVDFKGGRVQIIGNEAGISAAKNRIDQAVILAVNSDGYFPDATLTCLILNNYSAIKFQPVLKIRKYAIRTEQLDPNRQYFLFDSLDEDSLADRMETLALKKNDKHTNNGALVAGFDPSLYMLFFQDVIQKNVSDLSDASIGVNFGKTFVSSVPEEVIARTLPISEVIGIGYGKTGLRPEFVRNFHIDRWASLSSAIEGEYEELSSGKFIVLHCVSQRSKKRYNIKLRVKDNNATGVSPSSNVIKNIATSETYFSVLGIQPNATLREIEIAFRRKALALHPDKCADALAEKAMKLVNEAWECLKDNTERTTYARMSPTRQRPKNSFKYTSTVTAEPFPEVESFKSVGRKLALCTVLKDVAQSEFRTTIETVKNEAVDHSMLRKLQKAWDDRSDDGKLRFPDGTDDWLIVETIRYKTRHTFSNGTFILNIDEATEDRLAKSCNGVYFSLESYDVLEALGTLPNSDKGAAVARLLSFVSDLQLEAMKISSLLDKVE